MTTEINSEEITTEALKVSDERLAELQNIQGDFTAVTKRFGELQYEQELLKRAMLEIEEARIKLIQTLHEEMGGPGQVDLSTGEFTPN